MFRSNNDKISLRRFKAQEDDLRSLDSVDSGYHSTYKCDRLNSTFDTIYEEFSDGSVDNTSEYVNTEQEQQGACHLQTGSSSLIGGPDQEDNDSDNYSSNCSPESGDEEPVVHLDCYSKEGESSDNVEVCTEGPVDVRVHEQGALYPLSVETGSEDIEQGHNSSDTELDSDSSVNDTSSDLSTDSDTDSYDPGNQDQVPNFVSVLEQEESCEEDFCDGEEDNYDKWRNYLLEEDTISNNSSHGSESSYQHSSSQAGIPVPGNSLGTMSCLETQAEDRHIRY